MERYSSGRLKLLEEGLQAQIAEFNVDFTDKDIHTAAKLGRSFDTVMHAVALWIACILYLIANVRVCSVLGI